MVVLGTVVQVLTIVEGTAATCTRSERGSELGHETTAISTPASANSEATIRMRAVRGLRT